MVGSPWKVVIESLFQVLTKQREVVPFVLLPAQAALDAGLTGHDLVPKARQLGMSTYVIARYLAKCLTMNNRRCVIISHEEEATKRLLATAQFILDHLRGPAPGIEIDAEVAQQTQARIIFKKTGSWLYIGTAGAKAFGRGDTITDLHCSEYAWWQNESLLNGLLGSVPDVGGEVIIESTGNGVGNDFEQRVMKAWRGESYWKAHFFPWTEAAEYTVPLSAAERRQLQEEIAAQRETTRAKGMPPTDEVRLVDDFQVTLSQIAWRRRKIDDFGGDEIMFKQEFPTTIDECFQTKGGAIFTEINYRPTPAWKYRAFPGGGEGWLEGHPRKDRTYVVGVDSSAGVKLSDKDPHDNSVIQVGSVEDNEQVGVWFSGRTSPDRLGLVAAKIGRDFNNALLVFESNNHGLTAISAVRNAPAPDRYPMHKVYRRRPPDPEHPERGIVDYGYATTSKTKPLAVGRLRKLLGHGGNFVIHCPITKSELQSFIETEEGRLEAQPGAHDDFVMALVMMAAGWLKAGVESDVKTDAAEDAARAETQRLKGALNFDFIFDRIRRRKGAPTPPPRFRDRVGGIL